MKHLQLLKNREIASPQAVEVLEHSHTNGVATVHANSAQAGLIRLEQLIAESSYPVAAGKVPGMPWETPLEKNHILKF